MWNGRILDFKEHINVLNINKRCDRLEVKCDECLTTVSCGSLHAHHISECSYREVKCDGCGMKHPYNKTSSHALDVCPLTVMSCHELCGFTATRAIFDDHIGLCGFIEIECPYKLFGCDEILKRKDMRVHTSRKNNLVHHLALACKKVTELKEHSEQLQKRLTQSKSIVDVSLLVVGQLLFYRGEISEILEVLPGGIIRISVENDPCIHIHYTNQFLQLMD
jgi:hypothetical protein